MAKAGLTFEHMKNEQVTMDDGKKVEDTQMLDGGAKDSPTLDASNATVQYTTKSIPKDRLGGVNDPNG